MEITERDILATAQLTIKEHGESVGYYAASRADQLGKLAHTPAP